MGRCARDLAGSWTGRAVAIQPDGRIVVVGVAGQNGGNARFALARYDPNGTLDKSFGGDGRVTTQLTPSRDAATSVVLQANGKIVAAGGARLTGPNSMFALARYTAAGRLDRTFGDHGRRRTDVTSRGDVANGLAIQADRKIVAAGESGFAGSNPKSALVRYTAHGRRDTTPMAA